MKFCAQCNEIVEDDHRHSRNTQPSHKIPHWAKKLYWAMRLIHLADHPLCRDCEKAGISEGATECHHEPAHRGNVEAYLDVTRFVSLCHACHCERTAKGE